ncbi:GAF domain-containing protein [Motiliproteus coralliicola]|uniref:GAF domain-containing protein n=1 Tax=Motiliproteus coralliicola TaxID=2283196 RepID=A0A369WDM1_9GAMM|nr:GAF domain-containing protein [Motiliproteus coralliicola]RDE19747.1 GAF domain-containing protein [Motiliproteus coralliicola]
MTISNQDHVALLQTISATLSRYINESNPYRLFNGLLEDLLRLTNSEYGFIGEVFYDRHQSPYIQNYATTNIAWSDETRRLYQDTVEKGMVFKKLDSLYGEVLKTAEPVIANHPAEDPRAGGIPKGHPPLNSFLGLPFYTNGRLQGVVGIANRENGYDQQLVDFLAPFLSTCSNLVEAYRNNLKRLEVEEELQRTKSRMLMLMAEQPSLTPQQHHQTQPLPSGYQFDSNNLTLTQHQQPIHLTVKEAKLLATLIDNVDQVVSHQHLEQLIWPDVVVSDSSLRSLVLRLRKKVPAMQIQGLAGRGYLLNTRVDAELR